MGKMDWDIIGRYVLPSVLGIGTGLFSPWAGWGIEKRRQKLGRRRELVTAWRLNLIPLIKRNPDIETLLPFLLGSPYYASLRPHLKPDILRRLEGKARVAVAGERFPFEIFADEIGRIERQWKLV
jgi:hypothetical protein